MAKEASDAEHRRRTKESAAVSCIESETSPPDLEQGPEVELSQVQVLEAIEPLAESRQAPLTFEEQVILSSDVVDDELVTAAVRFINEKANETIYRGSEEIGQYLLHNFFNDEIELAASRRPNKPASYKALCESEELAVHPATLSVMVRVAAQERFFLANDMEADKLSYSHKAELVKLPDASAKIQLVNEIMEKSLSVRDLAERIREVRASLPKKDRPLATNWTKEIDDPARMLEDRRRYEVLTDKEKLKKIRAKTRAKLRQEVTVMIDKMSQWLQEYESLKTRLEEIDTESQAERE
jgi:hypothetical protein